VPVSRNQPSPQRQSVLSFVSPKVGDLLFFETVDAQKIGNTPAEIKANLPAYGTAHPDTENFKDHKLCFVKQADANGLLYEYYYAADRESQDDYNFEYSQADLGGNKYDTVTRTYVTLRSSFSDTGGSAAGDAMPDPTSQFNAEDVVNHDNVYVGGVDEVDDFSTDYIFYSRQQKRIGNKELDGLFVVEQKLYFRRVDIVTQRLDPTTEGSLKTVVKLIRRGETFKTPTPSLNGSVTDRTAGSKQWIDKQNWGLMDTGQNIDCRQLSHDWWQLTIQDVIPQGLDDDSTHSTSGKVLRTYTTYKNYTWPSVVGGLVFTTVEKKDGSRKTVVTVKNKEGKDGFSGPTKMTVTQIWKRTAMTPPAPVIFKTVSGSYAGVQFSVRVSNVLTEAITLTDFIGTNDPVYKLGEYGFPKPFVGPSTPTDWANLANPFIGAASQRPFRGGYLLEIVQIHHPS